MIRGVWCLALVSLAGPAAVAETSAGVRYVDAGVARGGDGSTWLTAFRDLSSALDAAADDHSITEIRLAGGTYTPDRGTGDRGLSFALRSGVALVGGYMGSRGPNPDARDVETCVTVLSGDLRGNDGAGFTNRGDNSRHIATFTGVWGEDNPITLDGLCFTGGASEPDTPGGALALSRANVHIVDCTFEKNSAVDAGAVWLEYCGPVLIENSAFRANEGGGLETYGCWESAAIGCSFTNNNRLTPGRSTRGGGAQLSNTRIEFIDCEFVRNTADRGGAAALITADTTFRGCTIRHNISSYRGGGLEIFGGEAIVLTTDIIGNATTASGSRGAGIYTASAETDIISCLFWANTAPMNDASAEGGALYIGASLANTLLANSLLTENTSGTGGAVYVGGPAEITHSTLWNNHAEETGGVHDAAGGAAPLLTGSILGRHSDAAGTGVDAQLSSARSLPAERSFIAGWNSNTAGNSGEDPRLVLIDSTGTPVVVLSADSPCIDAGSASDLPDDDYDLDADGERFELLPNDLYGGARVRGDAVDIGATEFIPAASTAADLNHDGVVNAADLAMLLTAWGPCESTPCPADLNGDGRVDAADLTILLISTSGPMPGVPLPLSR